MYNKIKIIILFIFINSMAAYSQVCPVLKDPTTPCGNGTSPNCVVLNDPICTPPTIGTVTPQTGTCATTTTSNNDARIVFANIMNADKAAKVEGATYTGGVSYNSATLIVSGGSLTATGLKHDTQYTFRFWGGSNCCFVDVVAKTPVKDCLNNPCPTKICTGVKITKLQ